MARAAGIAPTPDLRLEASGENDLARVPPASRPIVVLAILTAAAAVLGGLALRWAIRGVRRKRLIENVPRTPCTEASVGIVELKGTARLPDGTADLTGPLTEEACLWFDYKVQEWRGSGKNRHLHTIEHRTDGLIFECEDDSGRIPIALDGKAVDCSRKTTRNRGDRVYTERALRDGDPLYVLGSAELDPDTGDSLRIEPSDDGRPFIVSDSSESKLVARAVTRAFFLCAVGVTLASSCFLFIAGMAGIVSALAQILAAIGAAVAMVFLVTAILYNDLVFLHQQVLGARANISVALKKRFDLVPSLVETVKGYARHESEVQEMVATLRSSVTADSDTPETGTALRRLLAVRESYPDLKANEMFTDLARRLTMLENEITARRTGFNAVLERYRARIKTFPQILLARPFGFRDMPFLRFDAEVIPLVDFGLAPAPTPDSTASSDTLPVDPPTDG